MGNRGRERIRDLGYSPGQTWLQPGPLNAITDVPGVCIGIKTIHNGPPSTSQSTIRTGVTAILPRPSTKVFYDPVHAAIFRLNGTGEMTSSHNIKETGLLDSPILVGGTASLGVMMDGMAKYYIQLPEKDSENRSKPPFVLPCVAETLDVLSDQSAFPLSRQDVLDALVGSKEKARAEEFEGGQGGGTGMCCLGCKGGNGSSSRMLPASEEGKKYTLGAFVQANFGAARDLTINGFPIGRALSVSGFHGDAKKKAEEDHNNPEPWNDRKDGSIIVILATDMPLMPHQLSRLCRRVSIGLSRVGAVAHRTSGDVFLAFSTQSTTPPESASDAATGQKIGPLGLPAISTREASLITETSLNSVIYAVPDVVEEAVLNALCAGRDETGHDGFSVKGLPHDQVKDMLSKAKHALKDVFPGMY